LRHAFDLILIVICFGIMGLALSPKGRELDPTRRAFVAIATGGVGVRRLVVLVSDWRGRGTDSKGGARSN